MHNLHLVVVCAESAEDAISEAETMLADWGNENNWRSFGGCICEDGSIHISDKTAACLPEEGQTIEALNKMVLSWMKESLFEEDAKGFLEKLHRGEQLAGMEWFEVAKFAEHKYQVDARTTFDVLSDEFFGYRLDECGVTNLCGEGEGKKYVVFVDMHS